jgi:UDP-N-acetylmuramate dehydrogenase
MRKYDTGHQQLAAGWLLDTAGLRGNTVGPFYFHKEHANIVINTGSSSTGKDVVEFINTVQQQIFSMFGIHLVAEPLLVGEEYWQGTIGEPTIKNLVHTY